MEAEGRVAPFTAGDGTTQRLRLSRDCELVTADGVPDYYEAVRLGQVLTGYMPAAAAPGTVLGASAPIAVWNPPGSNVNVALISVMLKWAGGTLGLGLMHHVGHSGQLVAPTGTPITPGSNYVGNASSKARAFGTVTAGLANAASIRPSMLVPAATADPAAMGAVGAQEVLDGSIVIPPGNAWSYQEVGAAGTTPTVLAFVTWQEIPVLPAN